MPPRTAGTAGKDDTTKKVKDLEVLLACIKSSDGLIEIDYDEFMKHNDAPTRPAAQKRVERMSKALGVVIKSAPKKAASGDVQGHLTPTLKKKAGKKRKAAKGNDDDDEAGEISTKKQKFDVEDDNVAEEPEE